MQLPAWASKSPFSGLHVQGQGLLLCLQVPGGPGLVLSTSPACSGWEGGSFHQQKQAAVTHPSPRGQGLLHPSSSSRDVRRATRGAGPKVFWGEGRESRQKLGRSDCRVAMATARRRWTNTIGTCKVNPAASRQRASISSPLLPARDTTGVRPPESFGVTTTLHQIPPNPEKLIPAGTSLRNPTPRARRVGSSTGSPWTSRTCRSVSAATVSPGGYSSRVPPRHDPCVAPQGPFGGVPARWGAAGAQPAAKLGRGDRGRGHRNAAADGDRPGPVLRSLPNAASAAGARSALAAGIEKLPFWLLQLFWRSLSQRRSAPAQRRDTGGGRSPRSSHKDPRGRRQEGAKFGLETAGNFRQRDRDGCTRSCRRIHVCAGEAGIRTPLPGWRPRRQHRHCAPPNRGEEQGSAGSPRMPRGTRQVHPTCRQDGVRSNS